MADKDKEMEEQVANLWSDSQKATNDPWSPSTSSTNGPLLLLSMPEDPLRNMKSSEQYIETLEKKLIRIRGNSTQLKPKDMIQSLQNVRDNQTSQYLSANVSLDEFSDVSMDFGNQSAMATLNRKLNPEKQAINPVELLPLVSEDILAKVAEENQSTRDDGNVT